MTKVTEIVTMKTIEGIGKEIFVNIFTELERNFHSKQAGFIDSELIFNEKTDEWIIIQHWDCLDNLQFASKKMFGNPDTEQFVKTLDPKSVKMLMLPQLATWN